VTKLVLRRVVALVPMLFAVSLVVFGLVLLIPGDPASAVVGPDATREQLETVRRSLGLNEPIPVRYVHWLAGVLRGDLGHSLFNSYPVSSALMSRAPVTLSLLISAMLLSVVLGISMGVAAAVRRNRFTDRAVSMLTAATLAVPNFWLGLVLALAFALKLHLLPGTGYIPITRDPGDWAAHMILPAVTLAAAGAAEVARQTRAGMIDILQQDFIRTVRAKGMRAANVVFKHGLKNAMIPVITVIGLQVSRLFALSAIIETVFDMKGVGSLLIEAVFKRDIPVIQGGLLAITAVIVVVNLLVDLSYGYFNPRLRAS
jgi:peptide/nickel transport system permease protein